MFLIFHSNSFEFKGNLCSKHLHINVYYPNAVQHNIMICQYYCIIGQDKAVTCNVWVYQHLVMCTDDVMM